MAQPVFCLLKATLLESLVEYLHDGERKIDRWTAMHRCVPRSCSTTPRRSSTPTPSTSCSACSAEATSAAAGNAANDVACQSRSTRTSMRCSHFTWRGPVRVSPGARIASGPSCADSGAPSRS